jgi:hypothetical protein
VCVCATLGEWRHFKQLSSWPEKDAQLFLLAFFLTVMQVWGCSSHTHTLTHTRYGTMRGICHPVVCWAHCQDVAVAVEVGMAAAVALYVRDVTQTVRSEAYTHMPTLPTQHTHTHLQREPCTPIGKASVCVCVCVCYNQLSVRSHEAGDTPYASLYSEPLYPSLPKSLALSYLARRGSEDETVVALTSRLAFETDAEALSSEGEESAAEEEAGYVRGRLARLQVRCVWMCVCL